MADEIFMFAVTAGTMAALAALLFISRGRRTRSDPPPKSVRMCRHRHRHHQVPLRRIKVRMVKKLRNTPLMESQSTIESDKVI
jgi:hypothetical protein